MATPKQATFGVSRTINLGDYNSIRTEASATYDLGEGETPVSEEVKKTALDDLRKMLTEIYNEFGKKK